MPKKILFILTSQAELGNSGNKTGSWLEELAQPFYVYREAGHDVTLASVKGGPAPLDPMSLDFQWRSREGDRFLADPEAQAKLSSTVPLDTIDPDGFDAVFLVGGAGTAWDFPGNAKIRAIVERINARGGIVSAVCHGGLGLADALGTDGMPLVRGRTVTAVSNAEDQIAGFDRIVPVLPEDALRRAGGQYLAAPPFAVNVAKDGNLLTGQNPASARPLAEAVLDRLAP